MGAITILKVCDKAPSDVNIALDGSNYPRLKVGRNHQQEFFFQLKTPQATSGTSSAT